MTQDEIIKLARETLVLGPYESATGFNADNTIKFAKLLAQHEREACAQFIETGYVRQFENPWRDDLSAAIRARGQA